MNERIKGCGKGDAALTLYRVADGSLPIPLSGNCWHIRCGYRPRSKLQNGILLCDACIVKLGIPSLADRPLARLLPGARASAAK